MQTIFWDTNKSISIRFSTLDTTSSKLRKIAYKIGSLPEFVWLLNDDSSNEIYAENIMTTARKTSDPITYFREKGGYNILDPNIRNFLDSPEAPDNLKKTITDFLGFWYSNSGRDQGLDLLLDELFLQLGGNKNFYLDIDTHRTKLQNFISKQKKINDLEVNVDLLPDYQALSNFVLTQETNTVEFTIDDNSPEDSVDALYSIFNALHVGGQIYFLTFNSYYKLREYFVPPQNWMTSPEYISIKCLKEKPDNFVEYLVGINRERTAFTLTYTDDYFVEQIILLLNYAYVGEVRRTTEPFLTNTNGFLSIPGSINQDVLADIILCQPPFSTYFSFSDNLNFKSRPAQRSLYFSAETDMNEKTIVSSFEAGKIATKNDIYPFKTVYTQININRCSSMVILNLYVFLLKKLFTVYDMKKNDIFKAYKSFKVPLLDITQPERIELLRYGKDLAPEIMGDGFSKKCQPKTKVPKVIADNDEDAIREHTDTGRLFRFPVDHATIKSYKLACLNTQYPYLALVKNEKSPLGYQPCCSKKIKNSYTEYLLGKITLKTPDSIETNEEHNTRAVISTTKILRYKDNYGKIPFEHSNVAKTIEFTLDANNKILRRGIDQFEASFLECVLVALKIDLPDTAPERMSRVNQYRRQLLTDPDNMNYLKQEMYGYSDSYIVEYINNVNTYFDPYYTSKLLENIFNCSIILFEGNTMVLPRHRCGYYEFQRNLRQVVYVYINPGAPSDRLAYPHCELIVCVDDNQNIVEFTAKTKDFVERIRRKKNSFYNGSRGYLEFPEEQLFIEALRPEAQVFDYNGKVRMLLIGGVWVDTSPIPPMKLKTIEIAQVSRKSIGWEQASAFLRGFSKEEIFFNKLFVYTSNSFFDIKILTNTDINYLSTFVNNNKLARYLTNWFYFLFSVYLHDYNLTDIYVLKDNVIQDFIKKNIVIDTAFIYDPSKVKESFLPAVATGILRDNRLVINNQSLLDNLVFQLFLQFNRNKQRIINLQNNILLQSYFVNIFDFDFYPKETLIKTDKSIKTYLSQEKHILFDTPSENENYFFANNQLINKAYSAHPTQNNDFKEWNLIKFNNKFDIEHYVVFDDSSDFLSENPPLFEEIPTVIASKTNNSLLFTQIDDIK